ncbi:MAG: polyphosphate polymerase domain-containing protein [Bacteroidia bacterium]
MDSLDQILQTFDPITLQQMDGVKLQDRLDTKFMFREDLLIPVLREMQKYYYALDINGKRYNHYETLYYDTPGFDLYLRHHNGRVNRYKFRARKYVESNLAFFEVKFKNSKGRTIKDRIKRPDIFKEITDSSFDLVKNLSNVDPKSLEAKLWVNYRRMTFVSKISEERLTIDTKLTFIDDHHTVEQKGLVIAEVKQGSSKDKSPFVTLMRKYGVHQKSISKYCLAVISLNKTIKQNNFKPTLIYLNKLLKAS